MTIVSSTNLSAVDRLGVRLEGTFTAEEAMKQGGLADWNIRKVPAFAFVDRKKHPKKDMFEVVRDTPDGGIGVLSRYSVGKTFSIVQNEEHADFLNTLVDESGSNFELAGEVDEGRKVFLSMKMPGHIMIGGVDQVDLSILALNAHDASMSFTLAAIPIRYACANVLNSVHGGMPGLVRIRHTSGAQKNMVAKAREALDLSFKYLDGFQEDAEKMINTVLTDARFESILAQEFFPGEDAGQAAFTRSTKKVEDIVDLFVSGKANSEIRNTVWAGYNALTEWYDHHSPTRGTTPDESRAQKAIFDPSFKTRALEMMLAEV